jgi:hypothetical protein
VIATIFLFWQKLGLFFVKHLRFFVVLDKKQFLRAFLGKMMFTPSTTFAPT